MKSCQFDSDTGILVIEEDMKYTIFSVDDSRSNYIDLMMPQLEGWDRVYTECVDARVPAQFEAGREKYPYDIHWPAQLGHMGIWYTVLNALDHAPLITFEDDALLRADFQAEFNYRAQEIPSDFDFFSLFLPRDSDHMYEERLDGVSNSVCRTYQRYGGVSMYYSEQGAAKIKALIERDGFTGQYDDTLYAYSKAGELNGYCSKPKWSDLVYITGKEDSIVQETDYV